MIVRYYEDKEIQRNVKSIFLAGPTPRDLKTKSWRPEAIKILKAMGFEGDVFCPEFKTRKFQDLQVKELIDWELEHLDRSSLILFWVPRELKKMPAFTTNVEFGYHLKTGKVVYGRPDDAPKNRYLDYLYEKEYNQKPVNTLEKTIALCLKKLEDKTPSKFFTSDTHFSSTRSLKYSCRPYKNKNEMDSDLIRKWNSKISANDTVYHLGDFGNFNIVKKLNGKIIFILGDDEKEDLKNNYGGNFEKYKKMLLKKGFFDVVENNITVKIGGEIFNLTHKPLDCNKNIFNLFGHIHSTCKCKTFGLNVGIDCSNYFPYSDKEILFVFNAIQKHYDENVFCSQLK